MKTPVTCRHPALWQTSPVETPSFLKRFIVRPQPDLGPKLDGFAVMDLRISSPRKQLESPEDRADEPGPTQP
jgi:hypothetical protein